MNIWMINTKDENPNDKMTWKTLKILCISWREEERETYDLNYSERLNKVNMSWKGYMKFG